MADYVQCYEHYLADEKHASTNTQNSYLRDIRQFASYLTSVRALSIPEVTRETVCTYLSWLTDRGKSPATISRCMASLKSFFAFLVMNGDIQMCIRDRSWAILLRVSRLPAAISNLVALC